MPRIKNAKRTILHFPTKFANNFRSPKRKRPISIHKHQLWFRYSPFWNATYFIHIPHFGTQPILFTFPILERNLFYYSLDKAILERNLSDEKQLQCKRSFPTKTYRILERNLFYVGLYKTFFRKFVAMFPNVKKNNSTNN